MIAGKNMIETLGPIHGRRSMVATAASPTAAVVARYRMATTPFYGGSGSGARREPRDRVLPPREVHQRRARGQADPDRVGHRVALEGGLRRLQRPAGMVDVDAQRMRGPVDGVQAVALGEEIFERSLGRMKRRTRRLVGD